MTTATNLQPRLLRPSELKSHDRGGGARTTPLVSPAIGAQGFINGITEFAAGASVPFHSHNCEESVVLLEGEAVMETEGGPSYPVRPFEATWIPPNVSHRFRNVSADKPMKILWTYASPQATRTISATGETRPVSAEHAR